MELLGPAESLGAAQCLTNVPAAAHQGVGVGGAARGGRIVVDKVSRSGLREQTSSLSVLSE